MGHMLCFLVYLSCLLVEFSNGSSESSKSTTSDRFSFKPSTRPTKEEFHNCLQEAIAGNTDMLLEENMKSSKTMLLVMGVTSNCKVYIGHLHRFMDTFNETDGPLYSDEDETLREYCNDDQIFYIRTENTEIPFLMAIKIYGRRIQIQNALSGKFLVNTTTLSWYKLPLNRQHIFLSQEIPNGERLLDIFTVNYRVYVVTQSDKSTLKFYQINIIDFSPHLYIRFQYIGNFRHWTVDITAKNLKVRVTHHLPNPMRKRKINASEPEFVTGLLLSEKVFKGGKHTAVGIPLSYIFERSHLSNEKSGVVYDFEYKPFIYSSKDDQPLTMIYKGKTCPSIIGNINVMAHELVLKPANDIPTVIQLSQSFYGDRIFNEMAIRRMAFPITKYKSSYGDKHKYGEGFMLMFLTVLCTFSAVTHGFIYAKLIWYLAFNPKPATKEIILVKTPTK